MLQAQWQAIFRDNGERLAGICICIGGLDFDTNKGYELGLWDWVLSGIASCRF